jgi:hypothetical protein
MSIVELGGVRHLEPGFQIIWPTLRQSYARFKNNPPAKHKPSGEGQPSRYLFLSAEPVKDSGDDTG